MIFDDADVLGVPWELVIKEFRADLGTKSFNDVAGYASEFFSFISDSGHFFPENIQKDAFLNAARTAALRAIFAPRHAEDADSHAKADAVKAHLIELRSDLDKQSVHSHLNDNQFNEVRAKWLEELIASLSKMRDGCDDCMPDDPTELAELAELGMLSVFKKPQETLSTTGLVFAGFGDHDVFPSIIEYQSCGIVAGSHVANEVSRMAIEHDLPGWISAFAQTSMSDTFTIGISQDVFSAVMSSVGPALTDLVDQVAAALGRDVSDLSDREALIETTRNAIGEAVLKRAREEHSFPLRRVLGVLPVDEMAELAETLINLQSLKEKVTKPSESVGGPVDVAIITRSEGMVWVKRKHFFDPAINSRYVYRQAALYS